MEKGKLTDEQNETLQKAADRFVAAFKGIWDALKKIAKNIVDFFENNWLMAISSKEEKQIVKQNFGSIAHTKGRLYKSQVQLNKPKFIQARSRL